MAGSRSMEKALSDASASPKVSRKAFWRGGVWMALGAALILARLAASPWGATVLMNDSRYYLAAAEFPFWRLLLNRDPEGQRLDRPASYPLALKAMGVGESDMERTPWRVLAFQALVSAATLAAALALGGALFDRPGARLAWAALWTSASLSEFVLPWESLVLTEALASNGLLLATLGLIALSSPALDGRRIGWTLAALGGLMVFLAHLRESLAPVALLAAGAVALEWLLRWREACRKGEGASPSQSQAIESRALFSGRMTAIFGAAVLLGGGVGLWQAGGRENIRDANFANFVALRVLTDPEASEVFLRDLEPPREVMRTAGVSFWETRAPLASRRWQVDPTRRAWLRQYGQELHGRFLLSHPGLTWRLFLRGAQGVFESVGGKAAFEYSTNWGKAPRRWPWSETISRAASRLFAGPLLLANQRGARTVLALSLAGIGLALIPRKRPRAFRPLPATLFLAATAWTQFALAILFEGIEDYRHALAGSLALALALWVPMASFLPTGEEGLPEKFATSPESSAGANAQTPCPSKETARSRRLPVARQPRG
jgi:hypothetical protein